jgi:CRISPR type IV-associated protein Csf3
VGEVAGRELRYVQRRFPMAESIAYGDDRLKRIDPSAGATKGFRIPAEAVHVDRLTWWCIGDGQAIQALLGTVDRLGKKRSSGEGEVRRWAVDAVQPWGEGFPIVGPTGEALRHLPVDTPGLTQFGQRFGRLTYPYWLRTGEETVATPIARA